MMTMRARGSAMASDFDGTLCQSNWETGEEHYDPANIEAVRRYQQAGGLFGICTGRPAFSVRQSLEGIVDLDFYIVTTGAQVLDREGRVLFERAIDRDVAKQIFELYASDEVAFLAVTDSEFMAVGRPFFPDSPTVASLDEVPGKILGVSLECRGDEERARWACADLNERFGGVVEGFQNLGSVDIVARGCSKGSGVEVVRERLGVSCVAGIGDSYNDLPLLAAADVSYTFGFSPDEVQAAATHVVDSIADALADFE